MNCWPWWIINRRVFNFCGNECVITVYFDIILLISLMTFKPCPPNCHFTCKSLSNFRTGEDTYLWWIPENLRLVKIESFMSIMKVKCKWKLMTILYFLCSVKFYFRFEQSIFRIVYRASYCLKLVDQSFSKKDKLTWAYKSVHLFSTLLNMISMLVKRLNLAPCRM